MKLLCFLAFSILLPVLCQAQSVEVTVKQLESKMKLNKDETKFLYNHYKERERAHDRAGSYGTYAAVGAGAVGLADFVSMAVSLESLESSGSFVGKKLRTLYLITMIGGMSYKLYHSGKSSEYKSKAAARFNGDRSRVEKPSQTVASTSPAKNSSGSKQ